MITIEQKRTSFTQITLSSEEAKKVTISYLKRFIGTDCYITKKGVVEHWTSYPHGSGTTTVVGKATDVQLAADKLLKLLQTTQGDDSEV